MNIKLYSITKEISLIFFFTALASVQSPPTLCIFSFGSGNLITSNRLLLSCFDPILRKLSTRLPNVWTSWTLMLGNIILGKKPQYSPIYAEIYKAGQPWATDLGDVCIRFCVTGLGWEIATASYADIAMKNKKFTELANTIILMTCVSTPSTSHR